MRRSQFLKQSFKRSLIGLAVVTGLPSAMRACRQSTSQPLATGPSTAKSAASPVAANKTAREEPLPTQDQWRVAIAPGVPPFVRRKGERLVGFDVDLIRAIGTACGVTLQIEPQPFDALAPLIQSGSIDVAIGAIPISPTRTESTESTESTEPSDFSQPYFRSGIAIVALPENERFNSLKALKDKTIAVQLETAGARLAIDIQGSNILTFDQATATLKAVEDRNADVGLVALPALLDGLKTDSVAGVQQMGDLIDTYDFGIIVRPTDPKAEQGRKKRKRSGDRRAKATPEENRLSAINTALDTLIENGTYAKIYRRWLGIEPP